MLGQQLAEHRPELEAVAGEARRVDDGAVVPDDELLIRARVVHAADGRGRSCIDTGDSFVHVPDEVGEALGFRGEVPFVGVDAWARPVQADLDALPWRQQAVDARRPA